jgi:hypothetical protein
MDDLRESDIEKWNDEDELVSESTEAVEPPETVGDKYAKTQLRVIRETKDLSLDYLLTTTTYGRSIINISPNYQRRLRWSNKKRSLLIESLLLNIPIPPLFLYETDYNEYEVVDGRQRIDATLGFLKNNYSLTGLKFWKELNGKRFNRLPEIIKKGLLRHSLSTIVLLTETTKPTNDVDIRTILFERLNTGGEKLNPQELRNALYNSLFNDLLYEISETALFRKIWGIPDVKFSEEDDIPQELLNNTIYKTMTDCELVLRYFSIKLIYNDIIKGSIKSALDKTMIKYQNSTIPEIDLLRTEFNDTLASIYSIFKETTFMLPKTNRMSRPLYDGLMVAFIIGKENGKTLKSISTITDELNLKLNNVESYELIVGKGNTIETIKERIDLLLKVLYI